MLPSLRQTVLAESTRWATRFPNILIHGYHSSVKHNVKEFPRAMEHDNHTMSENRASVSRYLSSPVMTEGPPGCLFFPRASLRTDDGSKGLSNKMDMERKRQRVLRHKFAHTTSLHSPDTSLYPLVDIWHRGRLSKEC